MVVEKPAAWAPENPVTSQAQKIACFVERAKGRPCVQPLNAVQRKIRYASSRSLADAAKSARSVRPDAHGKGEDRAEEPHLQHAPPGAVGTLRHGRRPMRVSLEVSA